MKSIGSHPGAIAFRLSVMLILIVTFLAVFLRYADEAERTIETQSIRQTQRLVDSALVVAFATYASQGRLGELAALDGADPFVALADFFEHNIRYRGRLVGDPAALEPGWYYRESSGDLVYLPLHLGQPAYFRLTLLYDDVDGDGDFDFAADRFRALKFLQL